jgi:predicted DNA-binding WGR domain protein
MLEMRTVLKKIKPEENCYRYYEMVLRQADGQTIVEKRWGRLRYGILPVNTKKMENIFPDRQGGLEQFMKTLSQKEKRGYRLSDERGLI